MTEQLAPVGEDPRIAKIRAWLDGDESAIHKLNGIRAILDSAPAREKPESVPDVSWIEFGKPRSENLDGYTPTHEDVVSGD